MNGIDGKAQFRILEGDGIDRNAVGALVEAVERSGEAAIFSGGDVQDKAELYAPGAQRSLPISGNLRLCPAERREGQSGKSDESES